MNILQINTFFNKGGAAQIARALYNKLNDSSNLSSYFAYGRGEKINDSNLYKTSFNLEVYLHGIITRIIGLEGIGTYFSTKSLINYIENHKIDLIHLHNIHGYYLDFSFIDYIKENNFPVVWTLHDTWAITGNCAYYFNCYRWKNGCGNCPNLNTYPSNYNDQSKKMWEKKKKKFTYGWKPRIITPSKWLADKVKKSFLKEHKVKVINNGVNISTFRSRNNKSIRKKLDISLNKKIVLFVAADLGDKRKGAKYFFEALSYLKNENYMIVTIGKRYEVKFDDINIEIKQLGYIYDREKLAEIYSMSDVFCTTSLDEVFGLTVTEALSSGTPVVGFDVGGVSEQLTGNCGFIVESKNINELAKKLDQLLSNKKLNKKISNNARKKAVENYSIDKMVNKYTKLYEELL